MKTKRSERANVSYERESRREIVITRARRPTVGIDKRKPVKSPVGIGPRRRGEAPATG